MKTKILSALTREIHGQNEINRIAYEIVLDLLPQVAKFIGKRVTTISGLAAKFKDGVLIKKVLPVPVLEDHKFQIRSSYITERCNNLYLNVSICLYGGSYEDNTAYTSYFERTYCLGKVKDNLLESVEPESSFDQ